MSLLLLALRFAFDAQIVTEVMADWLTRLLPPQAFDFFLERLQFGAKPLLFVLILVGQVGAGGGIGLLYRRFAPAAGSEGVRLDTSCHRSLSSLALFGGPSPAGLVAQLAIVTNWGRAAGCLREVHDRGAIFAQGLKVGQAMVGLAPPAKRRFISQGPC